MRPAILIATAVSGVIVALGVVALLSADGGAPPDHSAPPSTPTGHPAAFHLDATDDQRRAILTGSFERFASDRPERLGALKDDIALLLDRDDAVRYVVERWNARAGPDRYVDAAFSDLFRLVKRPEFVDPTGDLLDSPLPEIRAKALQAAQTQANPRLGPRIVAVFRKAADASAEGKAGVKLDALRAGLACGGDAFPALLLEAFRDDNEEVAVQALVMAADLRTEGTQAPARRLLETTRSRRVRLHAAALLMRFSDRSATDEVVAALDPGNPALAADAAHLVTKYRVADALPALEARLPSASGDLRRLLTLALLRLQHRPTWDAVLAAADGDDQTAEVEALQLLAASGDGNASPVLLLALDRGGEARVRAIAAGVATSQDPSMAPVVAKLIEQSVGHPADLDEALRVGGESLVPRLAALLREARDPAAQVRYLAWLAQIGGVRARDVMIAERDRIRRFADEQIRLVDLEARRTGTVAPPLPVR